MSTRHPVPVHIAGLMFFIAFAWGSSWPVMKVVLTELAPMHFRLICLVIGVLGLFAISWAGGQRIRLPAGSGLPLLGISLCNLGAWNILAPHGVLMIGAGRAAILCYTFPVWTALLGRWFLKEELTPRRVMGVSLGLFAVLLLLGSDIQAVGRSPLGAVLLIAVAIGWAASLVMMKKWPIDLPSSSFTAWQALITMVPVGLFALFFEEGSFSPAGLTIWPLLALVYSIFIFIFCNWAWTKIAVTVSPAVSSLSVLFNPVIAVFTSALLIDEQPQWADYAALVLVVCAMATVLLPSAKQARA